MAPPIPALDSYKRWVRRNRDLVRSLESLANGVTWLLPERFSNSDIGPEAVYAFLNIVSSVNQHIIDTAPVLRPWGHKEEDLYPWSLVISVLKDIEAVVEVAAHHYVGEARKYTFLAVTEAAKAIARLAAYQDSSYKMLLQGGEVAHEDSSTEVDFREHQQGFRSNGFPMSYSSNGHYQNGNGFVPHNSLEERAKAALIKFSEFSRFSEHAMLMSPLPTGMSGLSCPAGPNAGEIKRPSLSAIWTLRGLAGQLMSIGEFIHILRPLIYVLMIRKFGSRSWKPWVISLAVDITGIGLIQYATTPHQNLVDKPYELSLSEKEELRRRKVMLALYVMRDPFFTKYTSTFLSRAEKNMAAVPIIGFLAAKFVEILSGAQTRYTYMSGS